MNFCSLISLMNWANVLTTNMLNFANTKYNSCLIKGWGMIGKTKCVWQRQSFDLHVCCCLVSLDILVALLRPDMWSVMFYISYTQNSVSSVSKFAFNKEIKLHLKKNKVIAPQSWHTKWQSAFVRLNMHHRFCVSY